MSTSQIQEAVLAERERCVAIITTIADEMRADAVRADNEGKQITREAYEHRAHHPHRRARRREGPMSGETVRFAIGARVRIKPHIHDLSGADAEIVKAFVGEYPHSLGAIYYKVKLLKPRERCRVCGAPRDGKQYACVSLHMTTFGPHDWKDATTLEVHEAWLEEAP